MKTRKNSAFTLIEALTLFAAIAILASLILPMNMMMKRSRCISNLATLEAAKQAWVAENKNATNAPTMLDLCAGPAAKIQVVPRCPNGGKYDLGGIGERPRCSIGFSHKLAKRK